VDEPTLKASEFCAAFHTWAAACITPLDTDLEETRKWRENFRRRWDFIDLAIRKSCLLDRLIYGGETLRTEVCPVHKGHWSGCSPAPCPICRHGVCITGWVKNPGDPTSTNSAITFLVGGTPMPCGVSSVAFPDQGRRDPRTELRLRVREIAQAGCITASSRRRDKGRFGKDRLEPVS
jgi:hypothetical protein